MMNKIFENIYREFDNIILEVLNSDRRDMKAIIKEKSYYLSNRISDLICDTIKFEKIVNNIFDNTLQFRLKDIPSEFNIDISEIKTEFKELTKLEEIIISIQYGNHYGELGSIDDFTKIEKFKISLFLDAIMYLELGFEKINASDLQNLFTKEDLQPFYTGIKRTLIHELSHILDSFQIDMNELLDDFNKKEYGLNKSELKAHQAAFLYHFFREDGQKLAKKYTDFNQFINKIEKLKCWNEIEPLIYNTEVKKKYMVFLKKLHHYCNTHNILDESGEKPIQKIITIKPSEITRGMTRSEQEWSSKLVDNIHPEIKNPDLEPSFFERPKNIQKGAIISWYYYPEHLRPKIFKEIDDLIKSGKINPNDYLDK